MTLKTNSKKILDIYATQKDKNATKAYKEVHKNTSDITARTNAYKLLQKPEAQLYLQKHIELAKQTIVEIVADSSNKASDRLKASQDILDRTSGKAVQRTENTNQNLNINVELSQQLADDFASFLKQKRN